MTSDGNNETDRDALVTALLDSHGQTFSAELGIDLARNRPSDLFRWLCASLLISARISSAVALRAAAALAEHGWTTARKMADSTWEERVRVLNRSGYARYDEKTGRMLGDVCALALDAYGGDLRSLRDAAGRQPRKERELLKEFKGIGDVGADIFCREAQSAWKELYPFADRKAFDAAKRLGLPHQAEELAALVPPERFPALLAALVRTGLKKDFDDVKRMAAQAA